jgi:Predicted flavoproteins
MKRVVVIGAGAAGSMAAIFAAAAGAETLLLERTRDGGRKILISGGGRCNVLPIDMDETRFVTDSSPNLLRKMLRSWPLHEQVAFFENDLGIPLVEERELGKRFPASHKARDVRDGLLSHAKAKGVTIAYDTMVADVAPMADGWRVEIENGEPVFADAVIIATGGLSVPNTGSDGTGLKVLEKLGHKMNPTYAALTPLTSDDAQFGSLSGVSFPLDADRTRSDTLSDCNRRISFHSPWLQRALGFERVARCSAIAYRRWTSREDFGEVDRAWRQGMGKRTQASGASHRAWRTARATPRQASGCSSREDRCESGENSFRAQA